MRSKDIANLAGVTHRTIRHYHQIGLLAEPYRDRNGYRRYEVSDLIRLLRIKGLAAAGVALGDVPSFLESRDVPADDLLDALDEQLLGQIAQLEQQRLLVARLKKDHDTPSANQPFHLLTEGRSHSSTEAWREQLTLFSHLLGHEDLAKLHAIYDRMARDSKNALALGQKFDALGPDSRQKEIDDLASEYIDQFEDIVSDFQLLFDGPEKTRLFRLIYAHTMSIANESQRKMMRAVASRLG